MGDTADGGLRAAAAVHAPLYPGGVVTIRSDDGPAWSSMPEPDLSARRGGPDEAAALVARLTAGDAGGG